MQARRLPFPDHHLQIRTALQRDRTRCRQWIAERCSSFSTQVSFLRDGYPEITLPMCLIIQPAVAARWPCTGRHQLRRFPAPAPCGWWASMLLRASPVVHGSACSSRGSLPCAIGPPRDWGRTHDTTTACLGRTPNARAQRRAGESLKTCCKAHHYFGPRFIGGGAPLCCRECELPSTDRSFNSFCRMFLKRVALIG